jgi:hypothetical protein
MSEEFYYRKYLKYKNKYIQTKYNQNGGLFNDYLIISSNENLRYILKNKLFSEKEIINNTDYTVPVYMVTIGERNIKLLKKNKTNCKPKCESKLLIDYINEKVNFTPLEIIMNNLFKENNIENTIKQLHKYVNPEIDSYIRIKNPGFNIFKKPQNITDIIKVNVQEKTDISISKKLETDMNSESESTLNFEFSNTPTTKSTKSTTYKNTNKEPESPLNYDFSRTNNSMFSYKDITKCVDEYVDNKTSELANNNKDCNTECYTNLEEEGRDFCDTQINFK